MFENALTKLAMPSNQLPEYWKARLALLAAMKPDTIFIALKNEQTGR